MPTHNFASLCQEMGPRLYAAVCGSMTAKTSSKKCYQKLTSSIAKLNVKKKRILQDEKHQNNASL